MIRPGRASGRGSISTDHRSRSSTSFSVTVMTSVSPSISTRPKNCSQNRGRDFRPAPRCSLSGTSPSVQTYCRAGRRPGAGMQRAGDELPERLEILKDGAVRIVMMRGGVMHVGGQPDRVADAGAFHKGQQIGDLMLAPLRRAVAERDGVLADEADRQIGGDHFPGRIRGHEFALQPGQLRRTQDAGLARSSRLFQVELR